MASASHQVYCIVTEDDRRSYVGVTNNMPKRLRQHNGSLKGGAKATRGREWRLLYELKGFPDRRTALQYEWRLHRRGQKGDVVERRLRELRAALLMERVTTRAPPNKTLSLFTITYR